VTFLPVDRDELEDEARLDVVEALTGGEDRAVAHAFAEPIQGLRAAHRCARDHDLRVLILAAQADGVGERRAGVGLGRDPLSSTFHAAAVTTDVHHPPAELAHLAVHVFQKRVSSRHGRTMPPATDKSQIHRQALWITSAPQPGTCRDIMTTLLTGCSSLRRGSTG
jgi:hypothetical protein